MSRKKKLFYQSDYSLAKTGFGRATRALLSYLHKTGKYDIVNYCCGIQYSNPELKKTPWKSIGTLPDDPREIEKLNRDPNLARLASYGAYNLDKFIEQEKPDVYIAVQDIWGIDFAIDKIKQNSRNYAKRQITWFKKNEEARWFEPTQKEEIVK